ETSARSRLRNILVLLSRIFALAFLVLAFTQPYFNRGEAVQKGTKAVSIFIDNSYSMDALSEDVPLLDKAKQRAREVVAAYQEEDRFQILTMDFEGRHQRLVSKEDALALIDEVERTPAVQPVSNIMTRQKQVVESGTEENKVLYMISDFQRSIVDVQNYEDTTYSINLIPLQSVQERNISIDSAWFEAPIQMVNNNNVLLVEIRNHSDEVAENIRLSIRYEGQSKPVGTLSIPANSVVRDTVNLNISRTGWHEAELTITDFPVQFDDKYFTSFYVAEEVNILAINEDQPDRYLNAAVGGLEYFVIDNQRRQQLDYSTFSTHELIVLNDLQDISSGLSFALKSYVEAGGNLLVFPGRNGNVASYKSFLASFPANGPEVFESVAKTVSDVNTDEFIFNEVFENRSANLKLPTTQGAFRFNRFSSLPERILLTYRDGSSYLSAYNFGEGNLYVSAAPLNVDYNDLVRNGEVFVPMLFKMALTGGNKRPVAYTIGTDAVLEARHQSEATGEIVYKLKGTDAEFIPQQRIVGSKVFMSINQQVSEAGYYQLYLNPGETLEEYAFNYNRRESDLSYFSPADLGDYVGPGMNVIEIQDKAVLTATIEERSQGLVLWRWCLIFALVFLAIEVLLLRLWKTH
ncbi:MAG: BatA domain-containing protein, partial [Bacteroidota bacterium]